LEVNKTAVSVYGYSKEEFLSMTGLDIRPKEDHELFKSDVQKTISGEKPYKKIRTHLKKNGEKMMVESTAYILDFFGKRAVLTLVNDITQETRLKEELEKQQSRRKKEITKAMFKAEEKERTAIGLELHDNVNQLLTSARLYNELAVNSTDLQKDYARKCIELIDQAIGEIRKLSRALIAPNFNQKGLLTAIQNIASLLKMSRGLNVEINAGAFNEDKLDQGRKLAIYRIVQEQLNNVLKHAKASLVQVDLSFAGQEIKLVIKDNGVGIDAMKNRTGLGLANIESRAAFYKGHTEVYSKPGEGCTLHVTLKLNE
jgi:PAS domain S-box-containing protein